MSGGKISLVDILPKGDVLQKIEREITFTALGKVRTSP